MDFIYIVRDKDTRTYDPLMVVKAPYDIKETLDNIIADVWQIDCYTTDDLIDAINNEFWGEKDWWKHPNQWVGRVTTDLKGEVVSIDV